MRRAIPMILPLLAAACAPVAERPAPAMPPANVVEEPAAEMATPPPPVMRHPVSSPVFSRRSVGGITFEGVSFDSRSHRLVVIDQPGGPGSVHATAADAARSTEGIAAINAGFFTPEGAPLGLVKSSGNTAGSWNTASSLGSGVWFGDSTGTSAIRRRGDLGKPAALGMSELLQAGPLLMENGRPVGGLESAKTSARTMVLWDGGSRWWIGIASPCTLATLATRLSQAGPAGWKPRHGLNLDGGRSAELWVSGAVSGGPAARRPPWNRQVRNFLVLKNR